MRVALVGVGLIGGSIGLAARERLGAHVVGWNRSPAALELALERGAIDEAVGSIAEIGEADIAIAGVAVDALPATVRAICAALPDAVVSDVGSTKAALVAAIDHENFIGGHPLAGAESTGVAHARAELFDDATWYLTPRESTPGVLYERLARFVAGIGAVPTAIAPGDHDRLMAAVSHLPHVVANLIVAQAAEALGGETLPATGPSFRDATRVAGSNPELWAQIYSANRVALARRSTISCGGWGRCGRCSTSAVPRSSRPGSTSPRSSAARCWRSAGSPAAAPCARSASSSPTSPASWRTSRSRSAAPGSTSPTCRWRPRPTTAPA